MKKRKTVAVISLFLAVALLLCILLSVAKYITKIGRQSELTSQNFYFSSNYLKAGEVPTYEIYGNTVTFAVRNYIDSFRINPTMIRYTVTADGCTVDQANGSLAGAVSSSENITVSYNFDLNPNESQKAITVSVTGTGDFTQTLQATFIFINNVGLRYEIKDKPDRDYAELYIYTGNTAGNVSIHWDKAKLLIDETNDYIFGNPSLNAEKNSVTVTGLTADTTVKIVFFKNDITADYTCLIKESGGTITIS